MPAEIEAELKHETESAFLIVTDDDKETWCPKSLCEYEVTARGLPDVRVTLPTWFAEKEGLV